MLHCPWDNNSYELPVDGVSMKFSQAPDGRKVSMLTFHALFEAYKNSSGIMATLQSPGASNMKEISLSHLFLGQSPLQGSTEYIERLSTHHMSM